MSREATAAPERYCKQCGMHEDVHDTADHSFKMARQSRRERVVYLTKLYGARLHGEAKSMRERFPGFPGNVYAAAAMVVSFELAVEILVAIERIGDALNRAEERTRESGEP